MTTPPPATHCDPATGLCTPAALAAAPQPDVFRNDVEVIYVGDPMCSWCWGISPALFRLKEAAEANGIPYRTVLGGLRPDNTEAWTDDFKKFLAHHWEEVNRRSGQPFGSQLFKRDHFQYNTEPACRAVVTVRHLAPELEARAFELIQHHFYVRNEDPGTEAFYRPICDELGLDFTTFVEQFTSEAMRSATLADFQRSRAWGVTGFPTVIFRQQDQLFAIARGYATFEQMWNAVEQLSQEA
ncbi:DsbA family protein [Lewinella sp. W8]|uniref:DsbA family protein n=1 Tax=Lewinella sp. W8 TaxID=2528208 RepID=UPI00106727F3|nr:DsbA family protein [Lewinella sp. W8]MTB50806.1 DsbA family protein [Lewinella sp. W8]